MPDGAQIETDTPTFAIQDVQDFNNDPIRVRYQVSTTPSFGDDDIAWSSGWIKETNEITVDAGALSGGTYFWRVQTGDVCEDEMAAYIDPDPEENEANLCDDLGERPTSTVRSFSIGVARHGRDPRWAMWRTALGNGMGLSVDHASGNLLLEYPVDSLATQVGPLDIDLAYNSQGAAGMGSDTTPGLPPGWELSAGPGISPNQLPVRLKELPFDQGVVLTLRSGRRDVYVRTSPGRYATVGSGAGVIQRRGDAWQLTTASGGTYSFNADGTLDSARVSTSGPTEPGFDYQVDASKRFTKVIDPLGREVTFTYANPGGTLSQIEAWDGRAWTITMTNGQITSITDPNEDVVEFSFGGDHKLDQVIDGEAHLAATPKPHTLISYQDMQSRPRVTAVRPAGLGEYRFAYTFPSGPANALIATTSAVTDPRGVLTSGDDNDFKRIIDFQGGGLPIMIRGPEIATGWPVSRFLWDRHGNLACKRSPAANAITDTECASQDDEGNYPPGFDRLQTEYFYQEREPYLAQKRIDPAANDTTTERLVTRYGYDETYNAQGTPDPFDGLQAHYFDNIDLRGLPNDTAIVPSLQQAGLPLGSSARYFGELVPDHQNDPEIPDDEEEVNYEFKLTSTGGALVAIGNDVVIDCFAEMTCDQTVSVKLPPTRVSFLLEFVNSRWGSADYNLQWRRPGITNFETVDSIVPNTDALTMVDVRSLSAPPASPASALSRTEYSYPSNDAKLRRLAAKETLSGQNTTTNQSVDYTYDDFGRVRTEIDATTKAITHTYFDPNSDFATTGVCEATTVDRVGLETERVCDAAGRVTQETVKVGGMLDASGAPSPIQDRVTEMTYDGVGRVGTVTYPDEGVTTYDYDSAGRVTTETAQETDVLARTTSYEYFTSGLLESETLPDPDGGGPLTSPVIEHDYDPVGNETETSDERGKVWLTDYSAANLPTRETDPLGNETDLVYDVAGRVTQRKGVDHDGDGMRMVVHKSYDVLGRVTQRQLANLTPTTLEYDLRGLVTKRTDPDGVYVENTYDAAGSLRTERRPVGAAGAGVTRTLSYNGSGWLTSEEDFKHSVTTYGYDDMGTLKSVTSPVKPQDPITYTLNEAGEIEKTAVPRSGLSPIRTENDYDVMGRLAAERDGVGNETDYTYNLVGELLIVRDDRPVTLTSTYDRLGREIAREVAGTPGAEEDAEFAYDQAGNLKSATNAEGTVTVNYDDAGRVTSVTGLSGATTYTYEGDLLTSVADDSSDDPTNFSYNEVTGRLASMDDPVTAGSTVFTEYSDAGRLARRTDPAGVEHVYQYDQAGRRETETATKNGNQIALFDQDYDPNGRVISENQQVSGGLENGTWTYDYDFAGRLTSADAPGGITSFTYEYDLAGNRTRHKETTTLAGVPVVRDSTTTYDTAGRPLTSSLQVTENGVLDPIVTTTYTHDDAGNLTSRSDGVTGWVYDYDGLSRLTGVTQSVAGLPTPITQGLTYDPLGRNLSSSTEVRTPGGDLQLTEATNHYRGLDETLAKTEESITLLSDVTSIDTAYASGPSGMIAEKTSTQVVGEPLVTDTKILGTGPHSDVSYTTDLAGAVTSTQSYDPWGVVRAETGTTDTSLGFQSDPTDKNTGLVDMGARHYLPELGRFLTKDPARYGVNHYAYAGNDPASMWDPTGLYEACAGTSNEDCGRTRRATPRPEEGGYGEVDYPLGSSSGWNASDTLRHQVGETLSRSGISLTCHYPMNCPDLRSNLVYQFFFGDIDNCFDGALQQQGELRGSCVLAALGPLGRLSKVFRFAENVDDALGATRGLNLPFRSPALRSQVEDVVGHFDEFGTPPPGVRQGIRSGGERGVFENTEGLLPSQPNPRYYTEMDVWPGTGPRGDVRLVFGRSGGGLFYSDPLPELCSDTMMTTWISVTEMLPWLATKEPYFVDSKAYERLVMDLDSSGFDVRILEGAITSERELLSTLGKTLRFPDYYGGNWDAFIDCVGDLAEEATVPVALIWPSAHALAMTSLHAFVRSVHLLLSEARDLGLSDRRFQFEVFFLGDGLRGRGDSD